MTGVPFQLLAKAALPNAKLEQTETAEAMYWLRQIFATCCGLFCGLVGGQGLLTFVGYIVACSVGGTMWLKYQEVDTEDFPEGQPIAAEGLVPSIFLFVLCWVTTYSLWQT